MLNVRGLSIKYFNSDTLAVRDVNFALKQGSITSLVGESGSGKSTIVHAILGLLAKTATQSGEIIFEDKNLLGAGDAELQKIRSQKISLVSQGAMNSFTPVLSIGYQIKELLATQLCMTGLEAEQKVAELLESVGLSSEVSKRFPHELSGGQKQRAAIALALACSPKLLLADEPTTALDVITQKGILDLLQKLRRETGITILLVTHDLPMAASVSDNLLVMKDGALVEEGSAKQILQTPKTDYTKKLLSALTIPSRKAKKEQSSEIVLQADNLSVCYESKSGNLHKAVCDISLKLAKGETVAIVGESGSGKTTLMRALLGLQKKESGIVKLFGKTQETLSATENAQLLRLCGYVPQDPYGALPPGLSALQAVMEPFIIAEEKLSKAQMKEKAEQLLSSVGLTGDRILSSRAVALSGGQRQRVELARALALSPKLLFCDEPTSMQDVSTRSDIIDLLAEKVANGTSMIFVTHDLMLAACAAEKIIVMKNGKICEQGHSYEVLNNPQHEYTKALMEAVSGYKL